MVLFLVVIIVTQEEEKEQEKINKMVKRVKKTMIIFGIIFVIAICSLLFYGMKKVNYSLFKQLDSIVLEDSPNHINQIHIQVRGSNLFTFNAPVRIYYGKVGNLDKYKEYTIQNRGATLYPDNFTVQWDGDEHVEIIIHGDEQEDEKVKINFQ